MSASGSACPTKSVATALRAVRTRLPFDKLRAGSETRLQLITAALLHAASPIGGDVTGRRMAPAVLTGIGAARGSVAVGRIVIVVAGAAAARQPIQDQASGANTSGAHERERASNGVARTFPGPNYHAGGLGMRYHEKGIAHRQDRRAIDDDAIKLSYRGADQFLEAIAA